MHEEIFDHLVSFGPKTESDLRAIFGLTREQIQPVFEFLESTGQAIKTYDGMWMAMADGKHDV